MGGAGLDIANANGQIFVGNDIAVAHNGSANLLTVAGVETDISIEQGASAFERFGASYHSKGDVQGTGMDAALKFSRSGGTADSANAAPGWKTIFLLGGPNSGYFPLDPAGKIMEWRQSARGPTNPVNPNTGYGIHLSGIHFTNTVFSSEGGFGVDNSGAVISGSGKLSSSGNTVFLTAPGNIVTGVAISANGQSYRVGDIVTDNVYGGIYQVTGNGAASGGVSTLSIITPAATTGPLPTNPILLAGGTGGAPSNACSVPFVVTVNYTWTPATSINIGSGTNIINLPANGNVNITGNIVAANANVVNLNASNFGVSQNGTVGILGAANLNFNNTGSVTWTVTPNGRYQANVAASISVAGDGNNYGADVLANGTVTVSNANINFNNTSTVNVAVTSNGGGTQANVAFSVNASALGVSGAAAAYTKANVAYELANQAFVIGAPAAYALPNINAALATTNTTFGTVNTTFATENTTFGTINTTFGTTNTSLATIYARANALTVFANSGLILANVLNIAVMNTATVNVVATSNTPNGVNVVYTVNISGADWASAANSSAQTTFATHNTTFATINTSLGTINTSLGTMNANFGSINAALAAGNTNDNIANAALIKANVALDLANQAWVVGAPAAYALPNINAALATTNTTFGTINTSLTTMNGNFGTINSTFATINTTFGTENTTFGTLNTNIGTAYSRANAFAVFANSGQILANVINLAFMNTATVNVVATSNTPNGVNVQLSVNVSSSDWASGANGTAQTTFATINTTFGTVNTSLGTMNANFAADNAAWANANTRANSTAIKANEAYDLANTALVFALPAAYAIPNINSALATHNTTYGTLNTTIAAAYSRANAFTIFADSGLILANVINIAFSNTATINAVATSNTPNGANVVFSSNVSQLIINTAPVISSGYYAFFGGV
jgi:hypothetical protein